MANNITTHPRLWSLDTVGAVKAAGDRVFISRIHYQPAVNADDLILSEYAPDGSTAQNVIRIKAKAGAIDPVDIEFSEPVQMNGLYVSTIDGGTVYLSVDKVIPKITA